MDLNVVKKILNDNNYTCVICKNNDIHSSTLRGVKPLVDFLESGKDFKGYFAADKVIGKATAFLYVALKVKAVYAKVISKVALEVLNMNNIFVEYEELVENIINRNKTDLCPFEKSVLDIEDTDIAIKIIKNKLS